jgi:uncharacterized membrane protein
MYEYAIAWEWLAFAVRWLHVVTAIAWIGSSFYFIALDLGLVKRPGLPVGAYGEEWQVHGGGFYHVQKYLVAPAAMPEHLTWFKYESYFTWLSGFAMLAVVYYGGADLFLIDHHVLDVSAPVAILLSMASLSVGWICYDLLCKSPLGRNTSCCLWRWPGAIRRSSPAALPSCISARLPPQSCRPMCSSSSSPTRKSSSPT